MKIEHMSAIKALTLPVEQRSTAYFVQTALRQKFQDMSFGVITNDDDTVSVLVMGPAHFDYSGLMFPTAWALGYYDRMRCEDDLPGSLGTEEA